MARKSERYDPVKALLANQPPPVGEPDDYWEKNLERNDKNRIVSSLRNVFIVLTRDVAWSGVLAFDEFSNQVVKRKPPPFERATPGHGTTSTSSAPPSGSRSTTSSTRTRSS
jgi:hypothetical protein